MPCFNGSAAKRPSISIRKRLGFVTAALIVGVIGVTGTPIAAHAKLFRNSYISFELPQKWDCNLIDTEWVCKNTNVQSGSSKEAIIILTAKEVGPTDNLQAYDMHLKTPRTLPTSDGIAVRSQVIRVAQLLIANHPWVDGLHLNSEVRDYYTRYLATVKDRIAILVTFSAHKLHYSKYSADFIRAIQSLRVLNTRRLMNSHAISRGQMGAETLGPRLGQTDMSSEFGEDLPEEGSGDGGGATNLLLLIALALGAGGVFLLLKKNKKPVRKR